MKGRSIILGSHWDGPVLRLLADQDGTVRDLPLDGPFSWAIGDVVRPETVPRYIFEPRSVQQIEADLERNEDPQAQREMEAEKDLCARPHVVYAAFYGILPKVGMTLQSRLPTRLREQGADAGFVVATCTERAEARRTERAVARLYRLPEYRRTTELLRQLTRPIDREAIAARADDLRSRLSRHFDAAPDLITIDDAPLRQPLQAPPHRVQAHGHHAGTWVGQKGNLMIYEARGGGLDVGRSPLCALRRQDLVGRIIDVGPTPQAPPR